MGARESLIDGLADARFLRSTIAGCEAKSKRFRRALRNVEFVDLAERLRSGAFSYSVAKVRLIPKGSGERIIHILEPEDWVVQRAISRCLCARLVDTEYKSACHAVAGSKELKARGCHEAIRAVVRLRTQSPNLIKGDFEDFYLSVPCAAAADRVSDITKDNSLRTLLSQSPRVEGADGQSVEHRLLQGAPLSPLLASLYATHFDEAVLGAGANIIRYVDDFVAAGASASQLRLEDLRSMMPKELRLNPDKTFEIGIDEDFKFLGLIIKSTGRVAVPLKEVTRFAQEIQAKSRKGDEDRKELVQKLAGWWSYYRIGATEASESRALATVLAPALKSAGLKVKLSKDKTMDHLCSEVKSLILH